MTALDVVSNGAVAELPRSYATVPLASSPRNTSRGESRRATIAGTKLTKIGLSAGSRRSRRAVAGIDMLFALCRDAGTTWTSPVAVAAPIQAHSSHRSPRAPRRSTRIRVIARGGRREGPRAFGS
jgi:hypothetical protein